MFNRKKTMFRLKQENHYVRMGMLDYKSGNVIRVFFLILGASE